MATGKYGYRIIARHGYAIDRLARDMVAEPSHDDLIDFLALDAAIFDFDSPNAIYLAPPCSGLYLTRSDGE